MNEAPKRIWIRRVKGWRMPENTVSVCRPGKWGNPFKLEDFRYRKTDADPYCSTAVDIVRRSDQQCQAEAVNAFESWLPTQPDLIAQAQRELRGKNLACFCKITDESGNYVPCHADVLLEIANQKPAQSPS